MRRKFLTHALPIALVGILFFAVSAPAAACSVCYGDPDSPMVQGTKAGVLFMAGLIYTQIMLMGGVAAVWVVRARRLKHQAEAGGPPDQT